MIQAIPVEGKICVICGEFKIWDDFYNCSANKDGKKNQCKDCSKEYSRSYGQKNKESIRIYNAKRYSENRESILEYGKRWKKKNKEKVSTYNTEYRKVNKDEILKAEKVRYWNNRKSALLKNKLWHQNNKAHRAEYFRLKRESDLCFRIRSNLSVRLWHALKRQSTTISTSIEDLIGCSLLHLIAHIESHFTPDMTWENYGTIWEIDHIKPCIRFNLVDEEQQKLCFNWKNLQPLLVYDNRSKGKKYA
jgi:hypothetical protein